MTRLVVRGDGDVDELEGRVGVAEGDDGDVDVCGLADGLRVGAGVGDDDQSGLLETPSDVVREVTGGETTCDGLRTGVGGEFEDGALTVGTSGDDADIVGVLDSSDDSCSEDDLLPSFPNVNNVDAVRSAFPDIGFHVLVAVFGANMALGREKELDFLLCRAEDRRQFCRRHLQRMSETKSCRK